MADKASELDTFLGAPEAEPAPAPEPKQDPKPEPDAKPVAKPEPDADAPEQDDAPPTGTLAALQDERNKRRDWKEKAVRAETERDELRRQLEEAKKAAAAPQQPQYQPPPLRPLTREDIEANPMAVLERAQQIAEAEANARFSDKLDLSEEALRDKIGDEAVDKMQADWKVMLGENPSLSYELRKERNPYKAAHKLVEAWRLQRDIGTDPDAYKARLRAEWEAERGMAAQEAPLSAGPPGATLPRMAPSLANARSAAPRSSAAFTGPPSLDDILAGRKK
jgi:hypothetical protein